MAGTVLRMISRDQEERLRLITEHKNIMDWQSGMVEARREGIAEGRIEGIAEGRVEGRIEGIAEGRIEGIAEGRVEGIAEGRVEANIETAKNLLSDGMEPERVAAYTGLSLADVLKLGLEK